MPDEPDLKIKPVDGGFFFPNLCVAAVQGALESAYNGWAIDAEHGNHNAGRKALAVAGLIIVIDNAVGDTDLLVGATDVEGRMSAVLADLDKQVSEAFGTSQGDGPGYRRAEALHGQGYL